MIPLFTSGGQGHASSDEIPRERNCGKKRGLPRSLTRLSGYTPDPLQRLVPCNPFEITDADPGKKKHRNSDRVLWR